LNSSPRQSGQRAAFASALAVSLVFLAALTSAILQRGPWYDEFFTFYVTQPRFGWGEALHRHWLTDNHPPLYYALVRATAWLGDAVEPRRFVNLLICLGGMAGLLALARRAPQWRVTLALFAIGAMACLDAVFYGAELRSNFLAYVAAVLATAGLVTMESPSSAVPSRAGGFWLWAILATAFNTHLVATILTGSIAIAFVGGHLLNRDWRRAGRLVAICALATLPLIVTLAIQIPLIMANTQVFWIPAGLTAARWAMQWEIELTLKADVALTLAGLVGTGILAWRNRHALLANPGLRLILLLALGECLGMAVLLGLHMWRPIIIARYLVAMAPPILMALAIGANALCDRLGRRGQIALFILVALVAAGSIHGNWKYTIVAPTWNRSARAIAGIVGNCPGTVVHADLHWNAPVMDLPPADNRQVVPMAYMRTARTFGFNLEPENSRRMSTSCPTVFWVEHHSDAVPAAAVMASLRDRGFAIGSGELRRIGHGWIFLARTKPPRS
jgi:hypothetical protein